MENTEERPERCNYRGNRITDKLYECLLSYKNCRLQFMFGNGYYCSALLTNSTEHPRNETNQI